MTGGTARSVTRSETPISHRAAYLRRVVARGRPASAVTSGVSSGHRDSASRDAPRAVAVMPSGPLGPDGRRAWVAAPTPVITPDRRRRSAERRRIPLRTRPRDLGAPGSGHGDGDQAGLARGQG